MEILPNIDTCTWANFVTDCVKPVSGFLLAVHFGQSMTTVVLAWCTRHLKCWVECQLRDMACFCISTSRGTTYI